MELWYSRVPRRPLCRSSRLLASRRDFLARGAMGIGGLGLSSLMQTLGHADEAGAITDTLPRALP